MERFDLVVIGSGPAGEKGAAQAAYFGKRVALVERAEGVGGAPVNTGGIPTKTLRETAHYLTGFRRRELYGIGMGLTPAITLERLLARASHVSKLAARAVRDNLGAARDRAASRERAPPAGRPRAGGDGWGLHAHPRVRGHPGGHGIAPVPAPFHDPEAYKYAAYGGLQRLS
ncbi:hypothetical protein BH24CHL9_BH24CHL9_12720 [soil metagenome]